MTDLEITRLCAEAMGYKLMVGTFGGKVPSWHGGRTYVSNGEKEFWYGPLHDDAQAMALVKKFGLVCDPQQDGQDFSNDPGWEVSHISLPPEYLSINPDLNRAICECVAKMQAAKK